MKLLNHTVRSYIAYSIVVLLVSIPVFYLIMHRIVLNTVDNALVQEKQNLMSEMKLVLNEKQLTTFKKIDGSVEIVGVKYKVSESLYSADLEGDDGEMTGYRHLVAPVNIGNKSYKLTIHKSLDDSNDLIRSIVGVQLLLMIFLLGGLILINKINSQKIWKPFYNTLTQLQNYDLGKHNPIVSTPSGIDEFQVLEETVEHLIQKNLRVFEAQKEFTENAAHETQTPLAIFRGKLELLMQTEPLTDTQAELIGDLDDASQRLARLNKSLLLLTKIENNQYSDTEHITLIELVGRVLSQLNFLIEERHIQVVKNLENDIEVVANRAMMEIVVSNLINNAIRYNNEDLKLEISIHGSELTISNSGRPEPLVGDKVFERFYKSGDNRQSIGLGLAIVKKVCDLYGLKIRYQFEGGMHGFVVDFGIK